MAGDDGDDTKAVHVQMLAKQREGHIAFIRWMVAKSCTS